MKLADEVAHRTPSFSEWQQEHWLTCCGDAAAFVEPAGYAEIRTRYPELEGVLTKWFAEEFSKTRGPHSPILLKLRENVARPRSFISVAAILGMASCVRSNTVA